MDNDIEQIKIDIKNINTKVELILQKLETLDSLKTSSNKLDNHIDFIENTYDSLVYPINYLKNSINRISGNQTKDLLKIKDDSN
jgi:hypothetical protein